MVERKNRIIYALILIQFTIFIDVSAQNDFTPVPVWGLYLDLNDEDARSAASDLSKVGFSRYVDNRKEGSYLILSAGDISNFSDILRRNRRDGIIIREENNKIYNGCYETLNSSDSSIKYKFIKNNFYSQFHLQVPDHVPEGKTNELGNIDKNYYNKLEKNFKKYVKDKVRGNPFKDYYWLPVGSRIKTNENPEDVSYVFYSKKEELVSLRFDTIPGRTADKFKAIEDGECGDFKRFTLFQKFNTQPPTDYIRHYRPRGQSIYNKTFTVHFEKNRADYSKQDVQTIVNYINDKSYSIVSAEVEGYASVEGTFDNNKKLMKSRAGVILNALESSNDEEIELDTLIVSENWDKFHEQIEGTKYSFLMSLPVDSVKELIAIDTLEQALEPFFSDQRKAILNLKMSQKLTRNEKIDEMYKNFSQFSSLVLFPELNKTGRDFKPILMGIMNYLQNLVQQGVVERQEALSRLPENNLRTHLLFYKLLNDYYLRQETTALQSVEQILLNAHNLYVDLYENANLSKISFNQGVEVSYDLLNNIVDVQLLALNLISEEKLEEDFICNLQYPVDNERFYPFIINLLDYAANKANIEVGCLQLFQAGTSEFIFDTDLDPRLYYLLKKIILEGNSDILNYVYRSDNLLEFDLYRFLNFSIEKWNPERADFYDPEVDITVMSTQLRRLQRVKNRLCPWQIDQLRLDFNLKVIRYYLEKGIKNTDDEALVNKSFGYLKRYHMSRAAIMDVDRALIVAYQFNLLNRLFLTRNGSEAAYDLLNAMNRKNPLSGEALELFLRLAYYHNKNFISIANKAENEEICPLFSGEFSLYPYGKLKESICARCSK